MSTRHAAVDAIASLQHESGQHHVIKLLAIFKIDIAGDEVFAEGTFIGFPVP